MNAEKSSLMFASMVTMFSSQAMMAMGKIHNPMTGKIERDLQAAQFMIDLLEMLEQKTSGNLSDDESRVLINSLRDLRLNYVVEVNNQKNPASPESDNAEPPKQQDESGVPENIV